MNEITEDFKRQFKSALIEALKSGFTGEDIRKKLREQGYSSTLIEQLLAEFRTDRDIIATVTRQQKIQQFKEKTGSLKVKITEKTEKLIENIDEKITNLKKKIKAKEIRLPEIKPKLKQIIFKIPKLKIPKISPKIPKIKIPKIKKLKITKKPKEKPKLLGKIKTKLAKLKQKKAEKHKLKIYNLYYNLIIDEKRKLKAKSATINKLKDKKTIKTQKKYTKVLLNYIERIKSLEPKQTEINRFINTEEKALKKELKDLAHIKNLSSLRLREYIKEETLKLKRKQASLQRIINKISEKSAKFKQVISKI